MKQIFLVVLLSSMLFSAQKQIILGCFLKDGNGQRATKQLNKYIAQDSVLSKKMSDNSLVVELKKVGDYNVVTIAPFDDKKNLFITLHLLSKYYDDSYTLSYPLSSRVIEKNFQVEKKVEVKKELPLTQATVQKQEISKVEIEKKVVVLKDTVEPDTIDMEKKTFEKKVVPTEEKIKPELEEKEEKTPIIELKLEEQERDEEITMLEDKSTLDEIIVSSVVEDKVVEENYYIEFAIAFLVFIILLIIGIIFYKKRQKEEELEFDFTE